MDEKMLERIECLSVEYYLQTAKNNIKSITAIINGSEVSLEVEEKKSGSIVFLKCHISCLQKIKDKYNIQTIKQ